MESNERLEQNQTAHTNKDTDTENKIIEAEQTEIAVWESLLEIRYA